MRLSSIQMSGFKSFVEPTRVIFDLPLTGVVGPNGCGKSNIIDAIRWVLGESARNIRGETLDDIIFDGSDSRKRLDQASIEVVIDNSLGRIGGENANFSEIRIRREVSRESGAPVPLLHQRHSCAPQGCLRPVPGHRTRPGQLRHHCPGHGCRD